MGPIEIQLLGGFSLRCSSGVISDEENRAKKIWLLLAYLLWNRERIVPAEELYTLLWDTSSSASQPSGALKTTLHRARSFLDPLWPGAGHALILFREGGYRWNPDVPLSVDAERFLRLCGASPEEDDTMDEEQRLEQALAGLSLYRGDFLPKQADFPWAAGLAGQLHTLYLDTLIWVLPLLSARGRHTEAEALCRGASAAAPCHEGIHAHWMRALLALGRGEAAEAVYQQLSQRQLAKQGILPSEELRLLYRQAAATHAPTTMTMEDIREQLREPPLPGAMMCEYDFFLVLCRSLIRSMPRTGAVAHIALIGLSDRPDRPLSQRSLDGMMEHLGEQIRTGLRRGDAAARCSARQYAVLLPQADYENSCKVCHRLLKAFTRQYPHAPARTDYQVYPLSTSL